MYLEWFFKEKTAGEKSLEEVVVDLLAERKLHVTTAESCTGGLIAGTLVNVAGASDVLNEGYGYRQSPSCCSANGASQGKGGGYRPSGCLFIG